jgi:hypothetical protein
MSKTELMFAPDVARLIHSIRNQRIILDADLAGLYGVPTKRLNEQYRRNLDRFPADFAFQLTLEEWSALRSQIAALTSDPNLKSQIATSSLSHGGRRKLPVAFTEHGALMAANILNQRRRRPLPCPEEELNGTCARTWNNVGSARAVAPRHFRPQQLVQARPQWAITRGNSHRECR